jgi:hypothetical protein
MTKLLLFFSLIFGTCLTFAQVDPSIEWKILRLPHFDLIYDAKHQELANLYADRLEDNMGFLSQYFDYFPERTVVVIDDRTDLTNGYATAIPYRTVVVYPVLPGAQDTISDFGDWARELTMHEFTHILSFEPRRGLVKGLYYVFGNVVTPNILLPRWWLEGIAVDMETRTGDKGRLRSPYQDATVRAYVAENKLKDVSLAEINETSIHTWPQGARPYLFGSLMWSDMIAKHGQNLIKELPWRYGGRVPFFIEGPIVDETSMGYSAHLEELKSELTTRAQTQIQTLQKTPLTSGVTMQIKNGVETFYPVISPDGLKMVFMAKDDANKRSVRILVRPSLDVPFEGSQEMAEIDQRFGENLPELNPNPRKMNMGGLDESDAGEDSPPGGTIQRLAWFPDSKRFIFDKLDTVNRYHEVSDLQVFDLGTMKVDRLTRNERAREASVSLDGKSAVYVKLDASRTALAVLDIESKNSQTVYSPPLQARISSPVFISAEEIVFSERYQSREILKKFSLQTKTVQDLFPDYPDARFPVVTSAGLQFSSTRNGVSNVYLADASLKTARPLTNSSTLISSSARDAKRDELYYSELTASGFQIRRTSIPSAKPMPAELPKVGVLLADRYPVVQREVPVTAKPEPEDYTIWPYILPHYWLPDFSFYSGGAQIGGSTSGSDPLAKHAYSLAASYDTVPERLSANFLYTNNTTPATIVAKGFDYSTSIINTPIRFRQQSYELDALWEVTPISTDLYAGLGYGWISRDYENSPPANTEASGPSLIANYSNINMTGAQISPVNGWEANFSATEYVSNHAIESESFHLYHLAFQKYFSKWLPRHHAIMIRGQGQFIDRRSGEVSEANDAFTVAFAPFANSIAPYYIMRGYRTGAFLGKSLANYTFEYRFPIFYLYHGAGSAPIFIKRLHAALVADGVTVDGFAYNKSAEAFERVDKWKSFWSTGVELKFDLTVGYHFPLTYYLGLYSPSDSRYGDGTAFMTGVQF